MKHLFIVNPAARQGNRTTFATTLIKQAFERREAEYEIYITKAPGDGAQKIARDAQYEADLRVYACGGDGTINECASACAGLPNVAMAVFPCGTGNDFVKLFGDEQSKFMNIGALVDGEISPLDIVKVNDRYSINVSCIGLDSRIGAGVHDFDNVPIIGKGKGAYIASVVSHVFKRITDDLTIHINGQVITGQFNTVTICNGSWYGGSFNPVPEARADDGMLDVLLISGVHRPQLPMLLTKYGKGKYKELTQFAKHYNATKLTVESDEEFIVNLDGETMITNRAEFKLIPGGLRFLHPKGMEYFKHTQTAAVTV
ncbi:MAG: YegS/Rv2252/BmrU family lipid kinase [Oscillospiraceae bacterium]|nr:YegS/Rv2252/BmrU family lipid kinase [Oscillospiraceae bacterium]